MINTIRTSTRNLPIALRRVIRHSITIASALAMLPHAAFGQAYHGGGQNAGGSPAGGHPPLHVNPRWRECSFQLDAALTQQAWRQFTGEVGVVTYFRPLVDAEPMGRGRFEIAMVQGKIGIDDTDAAWNDTFVHPDSTHYLFQGEALAFPSLTARVGIADRTDAGVYFTKSPGGNYGLYGGQVQQNLARGGGWSAAARGSFVTLFGPEDLDFTVYGVDLLASRRFTLLSGRAALAPYAMASTTLSRSHEKSAVVALEDENVFGAEGTLGAVAEFSLARVAIEYSVARVPSMSIKIGIGAGRR